MRKCHIKRGDEVLVISGAERGKQGKVIEVLRAKERVIVEGVKMIKRHTRRTQNAPGAIVEREGTIHLSNVKRVASNVSKSK